MIYWIECDLPSGINSGGIFFSRRKRCDIVCAFQKRSQLHYLSLVFRLRVDKAIRTAVLFFLQSVRYHLLNVFNICLLTGTGLRRSRVGWICNTRVGCIVCSDLKLEGRFISTRKVNCEVKNCVGDDRLEHGVFDQSFLGKILGPAVVI